MAQKTLERLSPEECFALLAVETVGRFVYEDTFGPTAVPVNYGLDHDTIVFRVEGGSKLEALDQPVAFEVDHVDHEHHAGWSVLVRGRGRVVEPESVPALVRRMNGRFPTPWAAGHHNVWVKLAPEAVTGRRLAAPHFDAEL